MLDYLVDIVYMVQYSNSVKRVRGNQLGLKTVLQVNAPAIHWNPCMVIEEAKYFNSSWFSSD